MVLLQLVMLLLVRLHWGAALAVAPLVASVEPVTVASVEPVTSESVGAGTVLPKVEDSGGASVVPVVPKPVVPQVESSVDADAKVVPKLPLMQIRGLKSSS